MADFHNQGSPYRDTPVKDFYLDLWVPRVITPQNDDVLVTIDTPHHQRPDKLAFQHYGTANLYWVFAMRNPDIIIDPINDFIAGTKIFIPSTKYITSLLLS